VGTDKIKLTNTAVGALSPGEQQYRVWDLSLRGFGVLVSPGGAKAYFLQRKFKGRTIRVTLGRFGDMTADQARRKAEAHVAKIADGIDPVAEAKREKARALTLSDAFDMYVAAPKKKGAGKGASKAPQTIRDIAKAQRRFADWMDLQVTDITGEMVRARHAKLAKASPAQANLALRYLRAALGHIMVDSDDPVLLRNPVDRLNRVSAWADVKPRKRHIPDDRLPDWLGAVQQGLAGLRGDNELRDVLIFMLLTGCRRAEALGNREDGYEPLAWRDVDLEKGIVTFRRTKNRQEHELPVGRALHGLLRDRRLVSGKVHVFSDRSGRVPQDLRSAQRRIEVTTGLNISAHDLRRSFASVANRIGLSAYTVKRLLNHTAGGDVTEGYITVGLADMRRAMQWIEDHVLAPRVADRDKVVPIEAAR
jgi:integrase